MDLETLYNEIQSDEGCVLHAYKDHLGYLTLGVGRLVDERRGGGITEEEAVYLLKNDVKKITKQLDKYLPWWVDLSSARQRALVNMAFQLGINGLRGFRKMLIALEAGDYPEAVKEALDSKWANSDTPNRARRVTKMLLEG